MLSPILLSGLISTGLIYSVTQSQLHNQSEQFSQAVADHLAISVTDHLVSKDGLGLNVLLADLLNNNNFDFASVSNASNNLLAQVGKRNASSRIFTQQVTFQDTIAGSVQIGFNQNVIRSQINKVVILSLAFHGLLALILALVGWVYGDMIYLWIMQSRSSAPVVGDKGPEAASVAMDLQQVTSTTILVLKIRPVRLLPEHQHQIDQALTLYAGEPQATGSDDIEIHFNHADQLFQATCSGLLILALFHQLETPIVIKAGMHQIDRGNTSDFEKGRKHASYLASISENQLLTSRIIREAIASSDQYDLKPFHSSMTPDGEVYCIDGLTNQALIEGQARQLV
ncbi:MAG: hypothetical protein ABGY96_14565 [bacterium]|nr:hypothetical protein [Gammaproteobacteria bacterium]HIL94760.1 hypothetical protein [Pseudomonadales bacterium]